MGTHKVVTRRHRAGKSDTLDFSFTREMLPSYPGDRQEIEAIREYRTKAWEDYLKIPMPSINNEAWRRTDLRGLPAGDFRIPGQGDQNLQDAPVDILKPLAGEMHGGQLILQPNKTDLVIDKELTQRGVIFTDLLSAEKQYPELVAKILGKVVKSDEGRFAALAASLSQLGVFIYIPPGIQVEQPLHSVLWGGGINLAYLSHILVYVDEGASVTYVHESSSLSQVAGQLLHAGIVEMLVSKNAQLRFVELQSWGKNVWNITHERARVEKDGTLDWVFGAIGSRVTKNFSDIDLVAEGASGRMSGFYFADGEQHLDHDTQQNHLAPHTTSDLLYKGALKDRSRSVWQGMIYVSPEAQKTDGYQANRNLLLSPNARADSIPGLEILADDVRCTHGATVGKIDPDPLFYLRSRGIPYPDAERLIVEGFFDPIMQRIPYAGVRERFQQAIIDKLGSVN